MVSFAATRRYRKYHYTRHNSTFDASIRNEVLVTHSLAPKY